MKKFNEMEYHPASEKLVKILQTKTQNSNPLFFRVVTAFYFGLIAAQMRASISGWVGKGTIPINVYSMALSPSGSGKGHSTGIIENEVLHQFKDTFTECTFPVISDKHLETLAIKRATRNNTPVEEELAKVTRDFNSLGSLMFSFDSATSPAIKQMRQKLLMADIGACNLIVDEIAANLSGSIEALTTYLELFDKGLVKDKLVKSTTDNVRFEKLAGATPANMLLFGTPAKLLDGGATESLLMEMLEMGYARRCFFGFSRNSTKIKNVSAEEVLKQLFDTDGDAYLDAIADRLGLLADPINVNKTIALSQENAKYLIEYRLDCERRAEAFNETETIAKSEMEHRYFKALKLAGAYAFYDGSPEITQEHLEHAIKLAEDSGAAFSQLLTPERPYTKLAKYLAQCKSDVTLADLDEDLPCFKGSKAAKDDMILMATAWGYKNNVIIKKIFTDGIMFLRGESIEETDTNKMRISYSTDMTNNYLNAEVPFEKLGKLFNLPDYHWLNHHLVDGINGNGYRDTRNCIAGVNLLVLDIDGTTNLSTAKMLLKGFKAWYYTTKRHTETEHRFRIVLPMNYTLKMDATEYKEFINNVLQGLPFEVDESTNQQAKKWLTHNGHCEYVDGELFDVLPYIPKTSKNEERKALYNSQQQMDNLERWLLNNTGMGNRSDMLIRYAMILVDAGFDFNNIRIKVLDLNNKLADKLDESEITSTILTTVAKALAKKSP